MTHGKLPGAADRDKRLRAAEALIAATFPQPSPRCTVRRTPWVYLSFPIGASLEEFLAFAQRKHEAECETCRKKGEAA